MAFKAPPKNVVEYHQSNTPSESSKKNDSFQLRVAAQQFMNENAPIFAAFTFSAENPQAILQNGSLANAIESATTLAVMIAKQHYKMEDGLKAEYIRPFRRAAGEMIASLWSKGALKDVNLASLANEYSKSFEYISQTLDENPYRKNPIKDDTSLMLTAQAVTLHILKSVMLYDFRSSKMELTSQLTNAVLEMAGQLTEQLVVDGANPHDRQVVLQTSANRMAEIMSSAYERKARTILEQVQNMREEDKVSFFRTYDASADVVKSFKEWAMVFCGATLATARKMSGYDAQEGNKVEPQIPW